MQVTWENIKYFKADEFKCPCCGANKINLELVFKLDKIREYIQIPMYVTSGYRCEKHNKEVHGSPNSAHLRGLAADIYIPDNEIRYKVVEKAIQLGIKRIGIGKTFIHLDIDESLPHPRIWIYF